MYYSPMRPSGVGQQYRQVDLSSKVEGASPHRLVAILYEELIQAMALCKQAMRKGDAPHRQQSGTRALMVVQALESGLDFDKGGDVARALRTVYGEAKRLLNLGIRENDVDAVGRAQGMISELSDAWGKIG